MTWSEEETGRGLAAVALYSGNTRQAADALKTDGLPIPRSTLQDWKTTKRDDYDLIRNSVVDKVHERIAEQHMSLAEAQVELSADLTEELRKKKGTLDARDLSTAIRNLDVGSGIHTDKAQNLRAGSQPHIDLPDIEQTLRSLKASGVTNIRLELVDDEGDEAIAGTATELPEPRLPSAD